MKCESCQGTICVRTPENSAIRVGFQGDCVILDLDQEKICADGECGPSVQTYCRTFAPDNYPGPITYINNCPCPKLVRISASGTGLEVGSALNASLYLNGQSVDIGYYPNATTIPGVTAHFSQEMIVYPNNVLTYEPYIIGIFDKVQYSVSAH